MFTILKAATAYLVILVVLRLIGRRAASQAAPLDMIVLILFGSIMGAVILGQDRSFAAAVTGLFTVGLLHVFVGWLKLRSALFERIVDGTPIVVFEEGRWSEARMRRLRMKEADIRIAVRQQGLNDLDAVRHAIVERDGSVSIIPKEKK